LIPIKFIDLHDQYPACRTNGDTRMSANTEPADDWHQVLGTLEGAVDALCSSEPAHVAGAVATLTLLAGQHPALVRFYRRTIACVARARSDFAEGPALAQLLGMLGLAGDAKRTAP
jgi:hypothetical protein